MNGYWPVRASPICLRAQQAVAKLLAKNRFPSLEQAHAILANLLGQDRGGVGSCRIFLDEPTKTGLVYTERRELVLVETDRDDGRSALRDALPGKQYRKNFRWRSGSMSEKEN